MSRDSVLPARLGLGFLFLYHGLVPKILWLAEDERRMIVAHGMGPDVETVALVAGLAEIALGAAILILVRQRWPVMVALAALVLLLVDVAIFTPGLLIDAFNPVTTNVMGIVLAWIALRRGGAITRSHVSVKKVRV